MKPPRPYKVTTLHLPTPADYTGAPYLAGYVVGTDETPRIAVFGPFDESEARDLAKKLNDAHAKGWGQAQAGQLFKQATTA